MRASLRSLLILSILMGIIPSLFAQQKTKIRFEGANSMKNLNLDEQKLIRYIGNVRFSHEGTRMICDSAYHNPDENWFNAFGNVRINQESSTITGEHLYYDGKTSTGKIDGNNVKLVSDDATLTTKTLYFNSKEKSVYYNTPGVITTEDSKLTSLRGYYYDTSNQIHFAGNVVMENPDGKIYTDSLSYNTNSEMAYFFGPTYIFNEQNFAYCEKGWYNKKIEQVSLQFNAYILSKENKVFGDDIFYDKSTKFARITGNAVLVDTVNQAFVYGNKVNFWEDSENAEVSGNPHLVKIDNNDTLYLKADVFKIISKKDTITPDSTHRFIKALHNVKFYRSDIQGLCDSLIYFTHDSIVKMYSQPILWQNENQMTADEITIYSKNKKLNQIDFIGNAFITSVEDTNYYNQIRGKKIVVYFSDGKASKIDVDGNGQAVYFIRDGEILTMANRSESARIFIVLKNNKISKVTFKQKPLSNLYPIKKVEPEDITLKGFSWQPNKRPKDKYDIVPKNFIIVPAEKGNEGRLKILNNEDIQHIPFKEESHRVENYAKPGNLKKDKKQDKLNVKGKSRKPLKFKDIKR